MNVIASGNIPGVPSSNLYVNNISSGYVWDTISFDYNEDYNDDGIINGAVACNAAISDNTNCDYMAWYMTFITPLTGVGSSATRWGVNSNATSGDLNYDIMQYHSSYITSYTYVKESALDVAFAVESDSSTSEMDFVIMKDRVGFNASTSNVAALLYGEAMSDQDLMIVEDTTSGVIFYASDDAIGIGTSSPQSLLDINGNVSANLLMISGDYGLTLTDVSFAEDSDFYISDSDFIGVGTTLPTAKFHSYTTIDSESGSSAFNRQMIEIELDQTDQEITSNIQGLGIDIYTNDNNTFGTTGQFPTAKGLSIDFTSFTIHDDAIAQGMYVSVPSSITSFNISTDYNGDSVVDNSLSTYTNISNGTICKTSSTNSDCDYMQWLQNMYDTYGKGYDWSASDFSDVIATYGSASITTPNQFSFNHYAALFVTQNVGVGTSTPEYPLTVGGTMYGNSWNYQGGTQITSLDVLVVTSNQLMVSTLNITASDESGGVLTALDQDLSIDYLEILNDVTVELDLSGINNQEVMELEGMNISNGSYVTSSLFVGDTDMNETYTVASSQIPYGLLVEGNMGSFVDELWVPSDLYTDIVYDDVNVDADLVFNSYEVVNTFNVNSQYDSDATTTPESGGYTDSSGTLTDVTSLVCDITSDNTNCDYLAWFTTYVTDYIDGVRVSSLVWNPSAGDGAYDLIHGNYNSTLPTSNDVEMASYDMTSNSLQTAVFSFRIDGVTDNYGLSVDSLGELIYVSDSSTSIELSQPLLSGGNANEVPYITELNDGLGFSSGLQLTDTNFQVTSNASTVALVASINSSYSSSYEALDIEFTLGDRSSNNSTNIFIGTDISFDRILDDDFNNVTGNMYGLYVSLDDLAGNYSDQTSDSATVNVSKVAAAFDGGKFLVIVTGNEYAQDVMDTQFLVSSNLVVTDNGITLNVGGYKDFIVESETLGDIFVISTNRVINFITSDNETQGIYGENLRTYTYSGTDLGADVNPCVESQEIGQCDYTTWIQGLFDDYDIGIDLDSWVTGTGRTDAWGTNSTAGHLLYYLSQSDGTNWKSVPESFTTGYVTTIGIGMQNTPSSSAGLSELEDLIDNLLTELVDVKVADTFSIYDNLGNSILNINNSFMGLGTDSPTYPLHVVDSSGSSLAINDMLYLKVG